MFSLLVKNGFIPEKGFSLEISGPPGSGRRIPIWRAVEELSSERVLYLDLAGRYTHLLRTSGEAPETVDLYTSPSPYDAFSLILGGSYGLVVLDSIPRLFFDMEASYRARWGLTALVLDAGLRLVLKGGRFIAVNYASRRPFGETFFAHFFTHRVSASLGEEGLRLKKLYPGSGEIVLGGVRGWRGVR